MSTKPSLSISKTRRLKEAQSELAREKASTTSGVTKQTTVMLEIDLLYAVKEVALNRKKAGIEPNTITGMIREALQKIVTAELHK